MVLFLAIIFFQNWSTSFVGRVNDSDGFVNVRSEPTADSPIVGTLSNKDLCYFFENNSNNWYLTFSDKDSVFGFIHKSRLDLLQSGYVTRFGNSDSTYIDDTPLQLCIQKWEENETSLVGYNLIRTKHPIWGYCSLRSFTNRKILQSYYFGLVESNGGYPGIIINKSPSNKFAVMVVLSSNSNSKIFFFDNQLNAKILKGGPSIYTNDDRSLFLTEPSDWIDSFEILSVNNSNLFSIKVDPQKYGFKESHIYYDKTNLIVDFTEENMNYNVNEGSFNSENIHDYYYLDLKNDSLKKINNNTIIKRDKLIPFKIVKLIFNNCD